jgi:hypothetical protein
MKQGLSPTGAVCLCECEAPKINEDALKCDRCFRPIELASLLATKFRTVKFKQ